MDLKHKHDSHSRLRALTTTSKFPSDFPKCDDAGNKQFLANLSKASDGCATSTSYNWSGGSNPTDAQRKAICKCDVAPFDVPMCSWYKEAQYNTSIATHFDYTYNCASYSGKPRPNTTEVPAEVGTLAPTTSVPGSNSSPVAMIAGIAVGILAAVLLVGLIVRRRNRKGREEPQRNQHDDSHGNAMHSPAMSYLPMGATSPLAEGSSNADPSQLSGLTGATHVVISSANGSGGARGSRGTDNSIRYTDGGGKWDDPAVVAARIPRDAIFFGPVLSRGAYGEVFRGTYRGETVAIKQLLPARRKDLKQIDDFLGEVKFMSSFEHERVVSFIGVAWNSLSDACMVVEFMENGDLRSVLDRWNEGYEQRSTGFDADKIKIALHVAHALTYLHSMQPVVVHRDLKSKNILLDSNFDAKVTDFGISRERAESTMTAGVGSSLWMAPEVMMGERYNEKADVFSFGVVLSELDTNQLPYFHARQTAGGGKIPETAIMQQVMFGSLSVRFSDRADPEIVQLGRACIDLNAKARPTAAQVFHRVQQVMQRWRQDSGLI